MYEKLKNKQTTLLQKGEKSRRLAQPCDLMSHQSPPHTHCRTLQWQITTPEAHFFLSILQGPRQTAAA